MWTRSLLKSNARLALSGRYWRGFALCLLLGILGIGDVAPKTLIEFRSSVEQLQSIGQGEVWTGNGSTYVTDVPSLIASIPPSLWAVLGTWIMICVLIGLCWAFFIALPLSVGRNRYFMESRQGPSPMSTATSIFHTPYLNVVKVSALVRLKILLGSILVIPGIYWSFCYRQVDYLLAENPYLPAGRAMELSRQMMDGEKWNAFVLDLSFFGWLLLCVLTLGIGNLFLEPYLQATYAELYAALRSKALAQGLSDETELGGFVRH